MTPRMTLVTARSFVQMTMPQFLEHGRSRIFLVLQKEEISARRTERKRNATDPWIVPSTRILPSLAGIQHDFLRWNSNDAFSQLATSGLLRARMNSYLAWAGIDSTAVAYNGPCSHPLSFGFSFFVVQCYWYKISASSFGRI